MLAAHVAASIAAAEGPRTDTSAWVEAGRPTGRAMDAVAVLQAVGADGLDPRDYEADRLHQEAARLADARTPAAADGARFAADLAGALERVVSDLHVGRVDARALGFAYDAAPKRATVAALRARLAGAEPVATVVAAAAPPHGQYALLREQLAYYRALAADPDVGPVAVATTVRPGAPLADAPRLARWLAALGDLPADGPAPTDYDGPLALAVQRFQLRHGLVPDGVIGPATARALAMPASARVRQIELALERLRWLPLLARDRTVIVNVPAFEAIAFDAIGSGRPPALRMPVVVGRALRTETPFFADTMTEVVFAPYWNVPTSILRNEILPKLRAGPGYLAAEEMEIVAGGRVLAPTGDALARLRQGTAALRQRPGAKNALGRVKFLFPNPFDVYMHDTPARALFARARRDFSHGCIRLGDAAAMAHWVLGGEGLDPARIDALLALQHETRVALGRPIAVVIAYATAVARHDGTIAFHDDVYRHDAALEAALRPAPQRRGACGPASATCEGGVPAT